MQRPTPRERYFALLGADAAAYLDVQTALLCQRGNGVVVGKGAVLGTVQVHYMKIFCPGGHKAACLCAGVLPVNGHAVVVALCQAHHLPTAQVNGWK